MIMPNIYGWYLDECQQVNTTYWNLQLNKSTWRWYLNQKEIVFKEKYRNTQTLKRHCFKEMSSNRNPVRSCPWIQHYLRQPSINPTPKAVLIVQPQEGLPSRVLDGGSKRWWQFKGTTRHWRSWIRYWKVWMILRQNWDRLRNSSSLELTHPSPMPQVSRNPDGVAVSRMVRQRRRRNLPMWHRCSRAALPRW